MSRKLPTLKAQDFIKILERIGFSKVRQRGSHIFFKHPDGRYTSVPIHEGEDIGRGLLRQILREINLKPEDFIKFL